MALRDQPYLPLYVQDYLTDEKLRECKPDSVGVYSFIMCLMHKSDEYGTILLKQKDKQADNQKENFAQKLTKHLPYSKEIILEAVIDLCDEKVLIIKGDKLIQKRMVADNELSEKRSKAGKKGGGNPNFVKTNLQTISQTNSENENENENKSINDSIKFICEKFEISEIKYPQNYFSIVKCVNSQFAKGEEFWKHFKNQIWNYFSYKEISGDKIHSLKTFLGTEEEKYDDGGWNSDNWIKKYREFKKKEDNDEGPIYPSENKQKKIYPSNQRKHEPDLMKIATNKISK